MEGSEMKLQLFTLGMITALCITGAFEASEMKPLMQVNLPWWVYAIMAIVAIGLAVVKAQQWD